MTLGRKIVLRNLCLLVGLLLLGATAMWCMLSMWSSVHTASDEYLELRHLESVRMRVLLARHQLRVTNPDLASSRAILIEATAAMQKLGTLQQEADEGSPPHENDEMRLITAIISDLSAGAERLSQVTGAEQTATASEKLDKALAGLAQLASEADKLVADTQYTAKANLHRGTVAIVVAFSLILLTAILISTFQYRGVMRPLRAIRGAVREIAGGRLGQRIEVKGEREFMELSEDVNRMAGQLDELYRTLEQKVETKSRELVQSERLASVGFLAAGVAHEINNPLGIMSGFAELSLKRLREHSDPASIEDARRSLAIIRDEAFRCREITEKLLSLSRRGESRDDAVSIASVIDDVAIMLRAHKAYCTRGVMLELPEGDGLLTRGSEAEFKQIFLNLLVNALEATSENAGQVRVSAVRLGEHIRVSVTDNGCGIRSEDQERIFEPFFSTRSGTSRGLGLGLSVTRAIVESSAGEIKAHSDGVGRGSTFTVVLPAHKAVERAASGREAIPT